MSISIDQTALPKELSTEEAVDAAYAVELAEAAAELDRGLPVLINCDKEVAPYIYMNLRARLRGMGLPCVYLDGRSEDVSDLSSGMVQAMLRDIRNAVRGASGRQVIVLPHLDLLAPHGVSLTADARELIPLLYENPELVWLGFKDPSFVLPRVVENRFTRVVNLIGIPRDRLLRLVTQSEAKKFGRRFNPWGLYKYVSGMNAARLRRILSSIDVADFPESPKDAYAVIRRATTTGHLEIPNVDLAKDIGGYASVKDRLRSEILDVLQAKDLADDAAEIERLEKLIPRGLILWGPPGTGKTLIAKAMATAMGAAVTIVSGPELKSRWVGESEQNLRQVFHEARQSAPSIIIFDELDSFASQRGAYQGSGVEHSMVNQLLTEMDGFHSDELVFVVATTNLVEMLDPALLRPGRFELMVHVPYPSDDDRREILKLWGDKFELGFEDASLEFAVRRTSGQPQLPGPQLPGPQSPGGQSPAAQSPGPADSNQATGYSGDHLYALCRALARDRFLHHRQTPVQPNEIDHALMRWRDEPIPLTKNELLVIATHEAGHALCSLALDRVPAVDRVSIEGEGWTLARVEHRLDSVRQVWTREDLCQRLCVLMAGREAERLLFGDVSAGAYDDLAQASRLAREMIVSLGMSEAELGPGAFPPAADHSQKRLEQIERAIAIVLQDATQRAAQILLEQRTLLETLRDELLSRQTLTSEAMSSFAGRLED